MNNPNRRDYYRIRDQAHIQYHQINRSENSDILEHYHHPVYLELMNELHTLDLESNRLLAHIPDSERTSAALFRVINKKIDMISRTIALVNADIPEDEFQEIDISEGGMAFHTAESLVKGQHLIIKAVLIPAWFSIITKAEVVDAGSPDDIIAPSSKPHWTRVNFVNIDDRQRQLIARHILKRQQQVRRQKFQQEF